MISFERITLRSNISYPDIQLLTDEEQLKVTKYLPEGQLSFRCKDGLVITSAFHTIYLRLNSHRKKFNKEVCSAGIHRLTLSGDNVFQHLCVLDKKYHRDYGVPLVFKPPMDQFVFACSDGMFLVNTFHIIQILP